MTGRIVSLNCSHGGVPKVSVDEAIVTADGLNGDRQRDTRFHGGHDRALCLYSLDVIEQLQIEGHPIGPGTAGENVTIRGLDWREVVPGRRLLLGDVEVEVTSYTVPCKNIRGSFLDEDFTRISHKLHPGWSRVYARVLRGGPLRPGDEVRFSRTEGSPPQE
jgi:MOSC domain-containing protein YiiM